MRDVRHNDRFREKPIKDLVPRVINKYKGRHRSMGSKAVQGLKGRVGLGQMLHDLDKHGMRHDTHDS